MDIPTAELYEMAKANPSMVHQVVAPAGSTLVFGETTQHATGPHTSGRERVVLSTGYGAANLPYWAEDGGYRPISEEFLASVPPQLSTLFKGRKSWVRNARYRTGGLSAPVDSRALDGKTFKLGVWDDRAVVNEVAAL